MAEKQKGRLSNDSLVSGPKVLSERHFFNKVEDEDEQSFFLHTSKQRCSDALLCISADCSSIDFWRSDCEQ